MTEDDTFKRLRGLTQQEASDMYDKVYEEAMQSEGTVTIKDVKDYVDRALRPYGWSVERLEDLE